MRVQNIVYNFLGNRIKCEFWRAHFLNNRIRWRLVTRNTYCTKKSDDVQEQVIPVERIRNFSIIAHVDHGKSTLADRLLEMTGAIKANSGKQVLDKLQVEKERGITVKAQSASLNYKYCGEEYLLNLIDTPGHVDFSNEVSRSLIACQGVILLVDANDGVQAQTVANFYLAFGKDLSIIPVINKVDLKNADPDRVVKQLHTLFDIGESEIIKISAKLGTGVDKVLEAIVERIPPPSVIRDKPLKALLFDSWYEQFRGPVALVYIHEGVLSVGQNITSMHTGKSYEVKALMLLRPEEEHVKSLCAGQIGCITSNMKSSSEAHIGDTLHLVNQPVEPLAGFQPLKAMVFAGVYPMDQTQHLALRAAIEKLVLNDSAVSVAIESSPALGLGWRLGFLGLLHMEVFIQRLEQEHAAESILTAPSVTYKAKIIGQKNITKYKTDLISFNNPADFPHVQIISELYEPMVIGTIITPTKYIGDVAALCKHRRGIEKSSTNIDNERILMQFHLPLSEIIIDFHDKLKSLSSGYASFDYEDNGYELSDIIKLYVLLNSIVVEELCLIVHKSKAYEVGKHLSTKLLTIIPRQQYEIVIQIKVGGLIIVRDVIKPYRKDVTWKVHGGGDKSRKKKLLAKQAEGKKRLKMIGNVALPRDAFISVLKK